MKPRMILSGTLGGLVLACCPALAEYEDYVRLKSNDNPRKSWSWNCVGNWDTEAFTADQGYYVPADKVFCPKQNDAYRWTGGPLVVEGKMSMCFTKRPPLPQFDDVTFLGGAILYGNWDYCGVLNSAVTVKAPRSNPFEVQIINGSGDYDISAWFDGSRFVSANGIDAAIRVRVLENQVLPFNNFHLDACNFQDYVGMFIADGMQTVVRPRSNGGGLAFGGAVVVTNGATMVGAQSVGDWEERAEMPAESLTLTDGGSFVMWERSKSVRPLLALSRALAVEKIDSLRIGGGAWADLDLATGEMPSTNRLTIARVQGSSAEKPVLPSGKVATPDADAAGPFAVLDWRYDVVGNGTDGYEVAIVHANQVVGKIKSDSKQAETYALTCPDEDLPLYWSDGRRPSSDSTADYVCNGLLLPNVDIDWPKATLTLLSTATTYCNGSGDLLRTRELNLVGSRSFTRYSVPSSANGVLSIEGGTVNLPGDGLQTFQVSHSCGFRFASEVRGTGSLMFMTRLMANDSDFKAIGSVDLAACNTNFFGRLTFVNNKTNFFESANALTVKLTDARNWGGTGSETADAFDAVTFRNSPIVNVPNDVTFAESDRSMFITNGVRFAVGQGKTLTLENKITYCGDFVQQGQGTLALGGTAAYLEGSETGHGLIVSNGALKVCSKTSVDGLDVSFAAGTKLIVPADSDGGFYNTRSAKPLSFAGDALTVEIVGFDTKPAKDVEVTLCTLNALAAVGLEVTDFAVTSTRTCRVKSVEKRVLADGNVAYVATVSGKAGIVLVVR